MNEETPPPPPTPPPSPPSGEPSAAGASQLDLGAILDEAWSLFVRDPGVWILVTVIHTLILALTCGVALIIAGPLFGGEVVMALRALKAERPTIEDGFAGFRLFGPLFLVSLVTGVLVFFGMILFVLPGVYLAVAWSFAPYLVIDRKMDFWGAMELSMKTVNAHFWEVLVVILVFAAINSVGWTVVLAIVVTQPLFILGLAAAYKRLFGLQPGAVV